MKGGWEGLYGRPRPVALAHTLDEHDPIPPAGDHKGSQPHIHRPRPYGYPGLLPDFPA